jgi:4-amino-4-deoxy-L-arabinose transferase-like glycosyltransferase
MQQYTATEKTQNHPPLAGGLRATFMKSKTFLAIFSVIYLLLALALFKNVSQKNSHLDSDSHEYFCSASLFYKTNSFSGAAARIQRFPYGYPLLMATIFKIFGPKVKIIIFLQILIALFCGLMIFFITRRLFNEITARISFFLFTFNLGFIIFPQFILSETFVVLLLLLFFERFSRYLYKPSFKTLATATFILGLSTLIKPVAFYYISSIAFLIPFLHKDCISIKIKSIFLALLCFYIPITSYVTINGLTSGNYTLTRVDTESLLLWLWPKARAKEYNSTYDEERSKIGQLIKKDLKQTKRDFYWHFAKSPIIFLKIWFTEVFKTYAGLFTTNLKVLIYDNIEGGDVSFFKTKETNLKKRIHEYISAGTNSTLVVVIGYLETFYNIFLYFFCVIAAIYLFFQMRWKILYLLSSYTFYFSMINGHDGCSRYRMPFEFALIILAAVGIYAIFCFKRVCFDHE